MIRSAQPARTARPPVWPLREDLVMRELRPTDARALALYFDQLGATTRRRFQPHPLTSAEAGRLCSAPAESALRLVIEHTAGLVAYFIVDTALSPHEEGRYAKQGITLERGLDFLFAPSVHDRWQNKGLASMAMPFILDICQVWGARSLVLMGGTQATNAQAIAFYEKFGFARHGGYETDCFNHDMRLLLAQPVGQAQTDCLSKPSRTPALQSPPDSAGVTAPTVGHVEPTGAAHDLHQPR